MIIFPDPWMFFDPSTPALEMFQHYRYNFRRFTRYIKDGEFDKLLRPGKFSTEPPNNLELILNYKNDRFEGIINTTGNV